MISLSFGLLVNLSPGNICESRRPSNIANVNIRTDLSDQLHFIKKQWEKAKYRNPRFDKFIEIEELIMK